MKQKKIYILLAASCIITSLLSFYQADEIFRKVAVLKISYYLTFVAFFIWFAFFLRGSNLNRGSFVRYIKDNLPGIGLSAILALIFLFSVKFQFRILADEANLIGISRSMLSEKVAFNSLIGYWYFDSYHSLGGVLDPRANLFPFLVSIIHTLTGYSPYNGFVLNTILSFLSFFNIYLLIKSIFGERAGLLNIVMCASFPIVSLCATSSAFETLNLFFIILTLRYFYDYISDPQPDKCNKILFTLVLLAQCRYEAAGIALLITAIILFREFRTGIKNITSAIAAIPVLYLPVIWQISYTVFLKKNTIAPPSYTFFSFNHAAKNIGDFMIFFFLPLEQQPVNVIGSYLAIVGLFYAVIVFFKKYKTISHANRMMAGLSALVCVYYFTVLALSRVGYINHPANFRYSLVFIPFFAFLATYFLDSILKKLNLQWTIVPILVGLFVFFHPLAINNLPGKSLVLTRKYLIDQKFLKKFEKNDNVLIITKRPGMYTIYKNFGASSFDYANNNVKEILDNLKNHLFSEIIVVQEISLETGQPLATDILDEAYKLEKIYELQNNASTFIRYSLCSKE